MTFLVITQKIAELILMILTIHTVDICPESR